jgi:hypothetical protein
MGAKVDLLPLAKKGLTSWVEANRDRAKEAWVANRASPSAAEHWVNLDSQHNEGQLFVPRVTIDAPPRAG